MLAAAESESDIWFQATPVPSLGTQLCTDTSTVAVAHRIGGPVREPHMSAGAELLLIHLTSITRRAGLVLVDVLDISKRMM